MSGQHTAKKTTHNKGKHGGGRASNGLRPMPGVTSETDTSSQIWPGPTSNTDDFVHRYSDTIDSRQFHVDYLLTQFQDFARPNLYKVEFVYGKAFENKYSFLTGNARVMTEMTAKTVNIPTFDIGKQEIKRCGQRLYVPTSQNYGDLQMTLMCDDNYTQRKFLHSWIKHMVYDTDNNFYHKMTIAQSCKVIIKQFDNNFNVVFAAQFNGAWPHAIGEIQLSQDSDGQIVEFPATFCYSTYEILSNTPD